MSRRSTRSSVEPETKRVAIYTRKSTTMGLEQEFNSLDSQRESCLAYMQRQPGWKLVDERYDDGGFTGANIDRPAFTRLMADVEAGIVERADAEQPHMGLTTWEGAPTGKIHRYDVVIAKNYLSDTEMDQMQRIVSAYLDMAEMQATRRIPMTMADWETRLAGFLRLWDREILEDAGKVTAELAKQHALSEFEKYRIVQDRLFESDFDRVVAETKRLDEGVSKGSSRKGRKP